MTFRPRARRLFATACLVVGTAIACDEPIKPPTTGGINVILVSQPPPALADASGDSTGGVQPAPGDASGVMALDAARVTVTGPTNKTVTSTTPSGSNFDVRVDGLLPGAYTVVVEGLTGNEVTHFGTTANVTVAAGPPVAATVPFSVFVPTLSDFAASATTVLTLQPTWTAVNNATGYVIQVADNAAFNNAAERTISGASATTGNYNATVLGATYVRVRAASGTVRSGASAVKQITLNREANDTSDAAIRAVNLGFGTATITRPAFNIAPLGDVDWFTAKVCQGDSVIINARAVKLSAAPSSLNTLLALHDSTGAGTALATSDNADSTDAEIRYLSASTQGYRVRVSAASGVAGSAAVGHYDAIFRFVAGARNTGTVCRSMVEVTPPTPSIGAFTGTRQLTARMLDTDGNPVNGAAFTWQSSNQAVATVDANGLVTANNLNGTTDITATSSTIGGTVTMTVQQVVSRIPIMPNGFTITTLGGTQLFSGEPKDANGFAVAGQTITWGAPNPAVVSMNNGTATGVTAGQASISATAGGFTDYAVVTVAPNVSTAVNDWSGVTSGTGNALRGIWGAADEDAFAVGDGGLILHYNGTNWTPMSTTTTSALYGVWGSAGNSVFASGDAGTILRYNGTAWTQMTNTVNKRLWGLWGTGPNNVFAVGDDGTILRFDGTSWTAMTSGTTAHLHGIWGFSGTDVYAVGTSGTVVRFNGTSWSTLTIPGAGDLWGVWGFSPTEAYTVGAAGKIYRWTGSEWTGTGMNSGTTTVLRDVWGTSGSDLYAVGDGGTVLRYNGANWSAAASGTAAQLEGVWGTQFVNSVFGVGGTGTIAHGQRLGTVDHVDLTPPTGQLAAIDATQQLVAQAIDPQSVVLTKRTFVWTSSDENVAAVSNTGLVTAVANGTVTITATTAGKSDDATITVQQVIAAVDVTPDDPIVAIGNSAQLFAVGKDANNHSVSGATFAWASSDNAKASVTPSGVVTAFEGTATITATSTNNQNGTTDVTASNVPVATVTVSPPLSTIPGSGTVQLSATTRDAGNTILNGRAVSWSSNAQSIAEVDQNGLVTGHAQGDAIITATSEGKSGTATVTVSGSVVTFVVVTPTPTTLTAIGNTVQLSPEAQDPAHTPVPGKPFTWVSENPAVATVSATGLVTAVGPGTVNIVATTDAVSGNGVVTVAQATHTVEVVPATGNIAVGQTSTLAAIAKDANGYVIASPPAAAWSTNDPDVATASPGGVVGAVALGATTITATISGKSGSSAITVVAVPVNTVEVTPAPTSVDEGLTVQLTATTKDASNNVLTGRVVSWSSNSPNATVSVTGLVTGVSPGTATISATSEGKTGTSVVTINARTVFSVVVTPPGATVTVPGGNQQFTAEARDNLNQPIPGKVFAWASQNPSVATVNPTTGVASVLANGQVTMGASVDGKTGYGLLTSVTGALPVTLWDAETSNATNPLKAVWGTAGDNVFAVGGGGGTSTIQRWDGANWAGMGGGGTAVLEGVWGTATNNVFAVGSGGTILRFDGSSWTSQTSNTSNQLYDVWGAGPTVVYAVGAAGTIQRYTGTGWTTITPVTGQDLHAVWGSASNDVWAVGNAGTVLHFTTSWQATTDGTEDLRGVWGTSSGEVFTVSATGTIRKWSGSSWGPSGTAGAALNGIYGSSSNDVYAVGAGGTIVRFDGSNWTPMVSGTTSDLYATWSRSGRVLATGDGGAIRRGYRGASVLVSPAGAQITAIDNTTQLTAEARDAQNNPIPGRTFTWQTGNSGIADVDANGLVTANAAGTVMITATTGGLAGSTNTIVAQVPVTITLSPSNPTLNAFAATVQLAGEARDANNYVIPGQTYIWGTSDDDVATVNQSGLVQAVSNGPVTITAQASGASGNTGVTVAQATAFVAVNPPGGQTSGSTVAFGAEALDANLFPIVGKTFTWATLNSNVATVDAGTGVATPVAGGQVSIKASVDGFDGYGLLTVASNVAPPINVWAGMTSNTTNTLQAVWGFTPSDVHAVGSTPVATAIVHFDGANWATQTNPATNNLIGLWGASATDVYAVGGSGAAIRHVLRYDGSWNAVAAVPAGGQLFAAWGSSPSDIWAVGLNGAIIHYNGTSWSDHSPSPPVPTLTGIWGTSRNDIWAVGFNGTILHYDGSAWTQDLSNPTGSTLLGIWGTSPTNVYAAGAGGVIIRYTGTWSTVASPVTSNLQAIWGTGPNDIYAVGSTNQIRFNGTDWVTAGATPGVTLADAWGRGNAAFAVGSAGTILKAYRGGTVQVTPASPTLATLGATQQMTATVRDAGSNVLSNVPVVWTSSDPYVATVNSSTGLVTAVGRGQVTITATAAGGAAATADITVTAIRVARIASTFTNTNAATQAFVSGDLVGSIGTITAAQFNVAPATLRTNYDVILVPYSTDLAANADWSTRVQPFLELGGGVVWEDMNGHLGATELGAVVTATWPGDVCSAWPPCTISASVPGLTDGIPATPALAYAGLAITAWNSALTSFIATGPGGPPSTGLYGRFGSGCIVIGPLNDYFGDRAAAADSPGKNHYNLILNGLKWAADCPLTAQAGPPASVVIAPNGTTLTSFGETRQFTAQVFDAVGNAISSPTITWQSSDPAILSISTNGLVQAIAGNGVVTVSATATGGSNPVGQVTVNVNQLTATITVSPLGEAVTSGTKQFTAVARNTNGNILTNKVFSWVSGLTAVATVDANGLATAGNSGQSTISASVDGKTASGLLTVAVAPSTPVNVWSTQTNPLPGYNYYGTWAAGPNNVFAVGDGGALVRWNGASWAEMPGSRTFATGCPGCYQTLFSVWGSSPSNVFAVGGGGAILRWNGGAWSQMSQSGTFNSGATLYRVWGSSANDVYAVGSGGTMIRFDGTTWTAVAHGQGAPLFLGVWGTAANDVYASGSGGVVIHFDGTSWSNVPHAQGSAQYASGISGTGPDNLFTGTYDNPAKVFGCTGGSCGAGTGWTTMSGAIPTYTWSTFATASTEVYAVGNSISRFTGSGSFSTMTTPAAGAVFGMAGDQSNSLWAVGGAILRGVRGAAETNWGEASALGSSISWSPNYFVGTRITAGSKSEVQSLGLIATAPAGMAKLALYSDVAGNPNTLLAQTGEFTISGAGTFTAPLLQQVQLQAGTNYWIVHLYSATTPIGYTTTGATVARKAGSTCPASCAYVNGFPSTYTTWGTFSIERVNYYAHVFIVP